MLYIENYFYRAESILTTKYLIHFQGIPLDLRKSSNEYIFEKKKKKNHKMGNFKKCIC